MNTTASNIVNYRGSEHTEHTPHLLHGLPPPLGAEGEAGEALRHGLGCCCGSRTDDPAEASAAAAILRQSGRSDLSRLRASVTRCIGPVSPSTQREESPPRIAGRA